MSEKGHKRGFTLIELLLVIGIIGILAAIALPQYGAQRRAAQDVAAKQALSNLAKTQEQYHYQFETYTVDQTALNTAAGWTIEPTVTVNILSASTTAWRATAKHQGSGNTFTYDSSAGGLQ